MHVDVVTIGVETVVEDKWRVHERTRIHETASLVDLHALHVKDEDSVEDLEGQSTLASEDHDFFLSDLVS